MRALPDIPGRTKPPITDASVRDPPASREHYDRISFDVRGGLLMRQMHHWAAMIFITAMLVHMMRVFVTGGGCSGLQYGFTFDEITNEDDTVMSKNGVSLLIDPMSYQYLTGAEIDYTEGLEGAQFVIKNPNATTTCGCGSSFSV